MVPQTKENKETRRRKADFMVRFVANDHRDWLAKRGGNTSTVEERTATRNSTRKKTPCVWTELLCVKKRKTYQQQRWHTCIERTCTHVVAAVVVGFEQHKLLSG
jgi:hypothetical protein